MRKPSKNNVVAIALSAACLVSPALLTGCMCSSEAPAESQQEQVAEPTTTTVQDQEAAQENTTTTAPTTSSTTASTMSEDGRLDLLVLVNKQHALPDGWEENLDLVEVTNPKGDDVQIDRIAYDAFCDLQADLASQGVTIELNSGYRSIAEQQRIWDEFMVEYGEDYVLEYVAEPGHSEHHTGIALDAYLILDGVPQLTNDEIFAAQDTWDIIHATLPEYGFILRYLPDQEDITGYTYEPWHYRYVGKEAAQEIYARGCTLEEYLGEA